MRLNDLTLPADLSQRAILGICAILSVCILMTLFYSVWQWSLDWKIAHQEIAAPSLKTPEKKDIIASISNHYLFGQPAKLGDIPITNLQLRVTGIVKKEGPMSYSKAYISISGQPDKIYTTGDILTGGVKIYDITPDAVVLENEGRLEKLPLPREKLQFKPRQQAEEFPR